MISLSPNGAARVGACAAGWTKLPGDTEIGPWVMLRDAGAIELTYHRNVGVYHVRATAAGQRAIGLEPKPFGLAATGPLTLLPTISSWPSP